MTQNALNFFQNGLKMKSYYANDPWGAKYFLTKIFSYEVKISCLWSILKWKLAKNQNLAT